MRKIIIAGGLGLLISAPVFAVQTAPGGAGGGSGEPLLVRSQEPDLSTDPASIDELRHKMQKDRRGKRSRANSEAPRPAQVAEIVAGKAVHDMAGQVIAIVEKVEGNEAILRSGTAVARAPLEGFGVDKRGLLLNLTKAQFDAMLANSAVSAPGT